MKRKKGKGYIKTEEEKRITFLNDNENERKKGQGRHAVHKIDSPKYQALVERVYELIKEGMRSNEILTLLSIEDDSMNERRFLELLTHAYQFAENSLHKDREYVFQLHMDRYENMYNKSIQMVDFWGRPLEATKDWHIIKARYYNAMKALKSKEELIGLHDRSVVLEFNDNKAIVIEKDETRGTVVPGYDLNRLNLSEKKELLEILKDARTVPIEGIHRVIVKTTTIEINTETLDRQKKMSELKIDNVETHDITFEEMPADVVSEFKEIIPIDEEKELEAGPIFNDDVPRDIPSKNTQDLVDNVNKNLLESFKKQLKAKKGK